MSKAKPQTEQQPEQSAPAADAQQAQITATQEELTEALAALTASAGENETLKREVEELTGALRTANEKVAELGELAGSLNTRVMAQADAKAQTEERNVELRGQVASLQAELAAAAEHKLHVEVPADDRLHALWTEAGGDHGRFEVAKRFAQALLA